MSACPFGGTKSGGVQRHRRRQQKPCAECRAANAAYMRELRRRGSIRRGIRPDAYAEAQGVLRDRHRAEFDVLYTEAIERRARAAFATVGEGEG